MFPGEKFIVILFGGIVNPEFLIAVFTRSLDSFTSDDKRPTISNAGRPLLISVSTATGNISTPVIAAQFILHTIVASIL